MSGYALFTGKTFIASIKSFSINSYVSSSVALLSNSSSGELMSGVSVISGTPPKVCKSLKYSNALKNLASPMSLDFSSVSKSSNG